MPAIPLSPNCLRCQSTREGWGCSCDCPEGKRIDDIFALCYYGDTQCRHITACTSDPRECGYWKDRKYPVVLEEDCFSDECETCDREEACIELGVIN